ncbi:MAG: ATP-binding cassette domain-containing protein [Planctomycetia bacterium]|nr:ATP-binding cassette domain-containing protein [Planctomycetia bacterium]
MTEDYTESPSLPPLLEASRLQKQFISVKKGRIQKVVPVKDVSLHINHGEIVALLGRNGAGKSTTFDMISGLTRPNKGIIRFFKEGQWTDVTQYPLYRRAQMGLCYLPQEPSIFAHLTTEENLLGIMEMLGIPLTQRVAQCEDLLKKFNLTKLATSKACDLSGGETRRLEIARSFIGNPRLILMDEPFAKIDQKAIQEYTAFFRGVCDAYGVSILIIDHNVEAVLQISDRVYFLRDGYVEGIGTPREIVRHPLVQNELLGKDTQDFLEMFP